MAKRVSSEKAAVGHSKSARISPSGTQKALLDANQRLQSIPFANEVATWTWDVVNDRVIADKNLARLFGVNANENGPIKDYIKAIHPDDQPRVSAAIAAAIQGPNDKYAIDYRVVSQQGSISWLSARGKVERDPQGNPKYFPGVVIDITERRASELKTEELRFRLEQQANLFDITLSSISDFAYIFDRKGRFVFVNQALLDLWGLKLADAVGKDFHELNYPKELAERLQRQIQLVFDTGTGLRDETPYTSPTGVAGYYEYIFRPVFARDGNVENVAGSTRDITERKRVEEELRQSQERFRILAQTLESQVLARTAELEQRNRDVGKQSELLRDLSVSLMETQDREGRRIARDLHDSAGQIIAAILINLWKLVEGLKIRNSDLTDVADETRKYTEELEREIRTTSYLLHPPMLDELGLEAALRWYVDGLKQRAGLDVQLEITEKFQRPPRDREMAIFRVVQECLTNVHRHSGSKSAHINLTCEGAKLMLEIRDSGRGIAAGRLAELRDNGAGLGLRGIRERVRQFAGNVRIESREGSGTTVLVTLPLGNSC